MSDDGTLSVELLETYVGDADLLARLVNDFKTLDALDRSTEEEATNLGYSQTQWVKIGKAIKSAVESWNKSGDAYVSECIQRIDLEVQKYPEIVVCKLHFDSLKKCLMAGENLTRIVNIHGDLFSDAARRVLRIDLLEKRVYCEKMHCYILGSTYKTMRKEAWKKSKNARKKALKKAAKEGDATGSQVLGVSGAGAEKDGELLEKDTVLAGSGAGAGADKDGELLEKDTVLAGSGAGAGADKDGELLEKDTVETSGGELLSGAGLNKTTVKTISLTKHMKQKNHKIHYHSIP